MLTVKALAGALRSVCSAGVNFLLLFFARLPYKIAGAFLFLVLLLVVFNGLPLTKQDSANAQVEERALSPIQEKFSTETKEMDFGKQEVPDNSLAVGEKKIVQAGAKGSEQTTFRSLLFAGKEFTRDIVETKITPATNEIIAFGTKKYYQELLVDDKPLKFWAKLHMFSTSYDSSCRGCDGHTAIGLKTGFGVVAVDPKVIPLRTKLYIPNYGFAIAGDTGGSIKGNKIDLGFDDVKKGWWSARYTDVYLLTE